MCANWGKGKKGQKSKNGKTQSMGKWGINVKVGSGPKENTRYNWPKQQNGNKDIMD